MSARSYERRHLIKQIEDLLSDRLVSKLVETSSLTKTQLKTLIADLIWKESGHKKGEGSLKLSLRDERGRISRGAFNRTLKQARTNVQKSIFTILLMGYTGYFDSPQLLPFIELSDQLRTLKEEVGEGRSSQWIITRVLAVVERISRGESFRDEL